MDDLPSKSTSYPLEYKGSTLPWLISCWERAILETMHDLFLLMLNLSQLSRKGNIIEVFVGALAKI